MDAHSGNGTTVIVKHSSSDAKHSYSDLLAIADQAAWAVHRNSVTARVYGIDDLKAEARLALVKIGLDEVSTWPASHVHRAIRTDVAGAVVRVYGTRGSARREAWARMASVDGLMAQPSDGSRRVPWEPRAKDDVAQQALDRLDLQTVAKAKAERGRSFERDPAVQKVKADWSCRTRSISSQALRGVPMYNPVPRPTEADLDRLVSRLHRDPADPSACWHLLGKDGQPITTYQPRVTVAGRRNVVVSRLLYRMEHGTDPGRMTTEHTCGNGKRGCVSPHHLVLLPLVANVMADTSQCAGAVNARKTQCKWGHSLTDPANVRIDTDRKGRAHRVCRTCERKRSQR